MSGHSKWAKIKHQKGVTDAKRGAIFTKLAKNITLAAKEGGGDLSSNFTLRLAVSKAKEVNMPADNIERAIKKGTGEGAKVAVQRLSYEAFYGDVGILIDCTTDNTNRTYSEVKNIMETNGAKMSSAGSVSWQFSEKGLIVIRPAKLKKSEKYGAEDTYEPMDPAAVELDLFEIEGIVDVLESEDEDEEGNKYKTFEVYTDKVDFAKVHKIIEERGYQILSFQLVKESKELVNVSEELRTKLDTLEELLEEHDDVDAFWTTAA